MKLEMTDRDKKLLIGLAVFVIIVCFGYWGIFPILMDMQDIEEDIMVQSDLQQRNSLKIAQLAGLRMDNQAYEEEILAARADFYKMMSSDEIDREFTKKALNHNLMVYDMTISMSADPASLVPYPYSHRAFYGQEEDLESKDIFEEVVLSDELLFADAEDEEFTGIYWASVSLVLVGSSQDLQDFMEELLHEGKKIRMCSFWYENSRERVTDEDNANDGVQDGRLTLSFEVYMCEE